MGLKEWYLTETNGDTCDQCHREFSGKAMATIDGDLVCIACVNHLENKEYDKEDELTTQWIEIGK